MLGSFHKLAVTQLPSGSVALPFLVSMREPSLEIKNGLKQNILDQKVGGNRGIRKVSGGGVCFIIEGLYMSEETEKKTVVETMIARFYTGCVHTTNIGAKVLNVVLFGVMR